MKTKTVKKHFEYAKEVRCLADGQVFNILNPNRNIHIYDSDFWLTTKDGKAVKLTNGDEFAKIISYKDTYTVSKDFILEAHESACSTLKTKIENQFPELFPKVKLEVGKWYKGDVDFKSLIYITGLENRISYRTIKYYGFTFGDYSESGTISNLDHENSLVLATKEEVETALIAEAKRKGFKNGVTFKSLDYKCNNIKIINDFFKFDLNSNDLYLKVYAHAGQRYRSVFLGGVWAEIISEPIEVSLEQIAEKFGVDVSQIKIKK
jgi:hypothetical protein